MYSWDNDYDYDKDLSTKDAYSFHDARKSYDDVAVTKSSSKIFYTYKSNILETNSPYPIVIGIDTTGSMLEWPRIFFEKLPLLYKQAVKYFPDCEISFQAINDYYADGEDVALQPAPFGKGPALDEIIGQLHPVGGGGGQTTESYEMFAAYNSLLKAPKSLIKPICIILGDETPFEKLPLKVARYYNMLDSTNNESISTESVFGKLHQKCDVFLVRKPYYGFGQKDKPIIKVWNERALMPIERIINIEDPKRVVDVILGILGILTGKSHFFEKELTTRQTTEQSTEVLKSLTDLKKTHHSNLKDSEMSIPSDIDKNGSNKTKGLDLDEE